MAFLTPMQIGGAIQDLRQRMAALEAFVGITRESRGIPLPEKVDDTALQQGKYLREHHDESKQDAAAANDADQPAKPTGIADQGTAEQQKAETDGDVTPPPPPLESPPHAEVAP